MDAVQMFQKRRRETDRRAHLLKTFHVLGNRYKIQNGKEEFRLLLMFI